MTWAERTNGRASRLPRAQTGSDGRPVRGTGWKATSVRIKARDGRCLIRWDVDGSAWYSGLQRGEWWGLVGGAVYEAGLVIDDITITRVWGRMVRTVRNREVTTRDSEVLTRCTDIAECVDHIVPRHILNALMQEQLRVDTQTINDFDHDSNYQSACLWCNEVKNRFEQLRTYSLSKVNDHPGYL